MKDIQNLFIICLLTFTSICETRFADNIVVAINCGGNGYDTSDDFSYISDDYFYGESRTADYTYSDILKSNQIKYTLEPVVYMTERHGENFGYNIPTLGDGPYTLVLKFAELYYTQPDDRVFNIFIGDQVIRQDFSILKNVPGQTYAHQEYIEISIKDSQLFYDGNVIENGYMNNKINISFRLGKKDLPKVDGIILSRGKKEDTDYLDRETIIQNWDKIANQQKQNKQNSPYVEPVEDEIEESQGISSLLLSTPGLVIIGTIVVFVIILSLIDKNQQSKQKTKKNSKSI